MPEFTLRDFIDNEAAVGPEEDEEDEEEFSESSLTFGCYLC
jgi:hypothetical protein